LFKRDYGVLKESQDSFIQNEIWMLTLGDHFKGQENSA
jgi:hypothetical protein